MSCKTCWSAAGSGLAGLMPSTVLLRSSVNCTFTARRRLKEVPPSAVIVVNETGSKKSSVTVALMKECASRFCRVQHRRLFSYRLPLIGPLAVAVIGDLG